MYEVLKLVRICEKMCVFPAPGGLFDQDAYLMFLFGEVFNADSEKEQMRSKKQKAEQDRLNAKLLRR